MTDAITEAAEALLVPAEEVKDGIDNTVPEGDAPLEGAEEALEGDEPEEVEAEEVEEAEAEEDLPPAPHSWKSEDGEAWKSMTPEQREVVGRREKERDAYVSDLGHKTAMERRALEQQAVEVIAAEADKHAQELYSYMQLTLPAEPDQRLLYTNDQSDSLLYQRQEAAYRAGFAQQQQLQQKIVGYQQQADEARRMGAEADTAANAEYLKSELPEFFDPEAGPKLRQTLESIGSELGYTPDSMAQANASDILALKKVADLREDAQKWRRHQAKRMETVRAAKNLPPMTRPNAGQGPGASRVASDEIREAARMQFQRDRSGEAALALLAQPRK